MPNLHPRSGGETGEGIMYDVRARDVNRIAFIRELRTTTVQQIFGCYAVFEGTPQRLCQACAIGLYVHQLTDYLRDDMRDPDHIAVDDLDLVWLIEDGDVNESSTLSLERLFMWNDDLQMRFKDIAYALERAWNLVGVA